MPNWCSTAYAIEGDANEIQDLYKLMKGLEDMEIPSVPNDFGTSWLGCLVDALGTDWQNVRCRGSWSCLELEEDVLKFSTETAWCPSNEVLDLVREKFPSLRYYYITEEPGMEIYETNDDAGIYFPDRYYLDVCTPEEDYYNEYFTELQDVFKWLEDELGQPVKSTADIENLDAQWREENDNSFCNLHEFKVMD